MALRKVAVLGHPVLRQVAARVPEKAIGSEKIQTLIRDMLQTMVEYQGRGLAAPQVHESLQVVVLIWDFVKDQKPGVAVLINPELTPLTQETVSNWEGCLSVPGMRGKVARPKRVAVRAFSEKGEKLEFEAEGFQATVLQHECDHLQGILYVDKLESPQAFAFQKEFERYHAPPESGDSQPE